MTPDPIELVETSRRPFAPVHPVEDTDDARGCHRIDPANNGECAECARVRAATADIVALLHTDVTRYARDAGVSTGDVDPSDTAAMTTTRWLYLARQLRNVAEISTAPISDRFVATAAEMSASGHYHTAAALLADVAGETVEGWRARVRAQMGGAT